MNNGAEMLKEAEETKVKYQQKKKPVEKFLHAEKKMMINMSNHKLKQK